MADVSITAANVDPGSDAGLDTGNEAGETITAGDAIYKASDGTWMVADCTTSATTAAASAIAVNSASVGQPVAAQKTGSLDIGGTLAVGVYVLSEDGAICPAADLLTDDYVTIVGAADATDNLVLGFLATGAQVA